MEDGLYSRVRKERRKPERHAAWLVIGLIAAFLLILAAFFVILFLIPLLKVNHYTLPV